MREPLEPVQYKPANLGTKSISLRGAYVIQKRFNALLKTLEEPPL